MKTKRYKNSIYEDIKDFVLSFLIIFIVMAAIFGIAAELQTKYEITYKTITIQQGETLWDIANEYVNPNQDIRDYIYKIKELNNMNTSELYTGQELKIIVYEEK